MRAGFREENNLGTLEKFINELPEGSKIIAIYSPRPGSHVAWFELPVLEMKQEPSPAAQDRVMTKNKGRK